MNKSFTNKITFEIIYPNAKPILFRCCLSV